MLAFLLGIAFVHAETALSFVDTSGEPLENMIIHLTLHSDDQSFEQVLFMHGDALVLDREGNYEGIVIIDDPLTEAPDYAYHGAVDLTKPNFLLTVAPLAFVKGEAYDISRTLVNKAELHFACNTLTSFVYPQQTDKYGSFTAYVPTGICLITASANNMRGKIEVQAERGQAVSLEILLNTRVQNRNYVLWILSSIILLGILVFLGKNIRRAPLRRKAKKEKSTIRKENTKLHDVIKTLYPHEQRVVGFLASHPETNSAVLRHELKIPRTTLARLLERLAVKKIVELERYGKMKKVRLAPWLK